VRTDLTHNDAGLLTQKIESANDVSRRRTTQIDWDVANSLQTERRVYDSSAALPGTLKARTSFAYNARGQRTAVCAIDPGNATAMAYVCGSAANAPTGVRQSRVTYCEQAGVDAGTCPQLGLVLSVDGPRTDVADVTSFTYYASDEAGCATAPAAMWALCVMETA
jgi:hypothetical protein